MLLGNFEAAQKSLKTYSKQIFFKLTYPTAKSNSVREQQDFRDNIDCMSLAGYATKDGTLRYRERFAQRASKDHFRTQHGLEISSIGIGTYLGKPDEATDERYTNAIRRAVELGSNVIDSAANYRFQRSERAIGQALEQLTQTGFSRDEIILCTKGGYLPFDGAQPRNVREYIQQTFVDKGIASFEDFVGGSHCMTPSYLQNQLEQSLRNMNIECVDVYYIHNPESQLGYVGQDEFYYRLGKAFAGLERNREQGKLKMYGVATWNGFRSAADSEEFHSLEQMVQIAREVGGDSNGFGFIQLPFNLAMPEALTMINQTVSGEALSTLEAADRLGVTVIASASILQGRMAQGLPDEIRSTFGLASDSQTAIQFVRSTPGITTALIGMSQAAHVEENLQLVGAALRGRPS